MKWVNLIGQSMHRSYRNYCLSALLLLIPGCAAKSKNGRIAYAQSLQQESLNPHQWIPLTLEIQSVNAKGKDKRPIKSPNPKIAITTSLPLWSPDGKKMTVVAGQQLYMLNADGQNPLRLGSHSEITPDSEDFAWSPDSQGIAYTEYDNIRVSWQTGENILVADSQLRRISNTLLGWAEDGKDLVFYEQSATNEFTLFRLPIPKTAPSPSTTRAELPRSDRRALATWPSRKFYGCQMHSNRRQVACLFDQTIELIDLDSGKRQPFLSGKLTELPVWSQNGDRLAFVQQLSSGNEELWTMDNWGKSRKRVAEAAGFADWQWSPDGQKLLYIPAASSINGFQTSKGIFTVDVNGENRQLLIPGDQPGLVYKTASWQPIPR
jgi:Tol biopolymer transport system component